MKAFIVDKYGKDSRLRAGQLPAPDIGDHDVLVRILASGVNPLDAKILAGGSSSSCRTSRRSGPTHDRTLIAPGRAAVCDCRSRTPGQLPALGKGGGPILGAGGRVAPLNHGRPGAEDCCIRSLFVRESARRFHHRYPTGTRDGMPPAEEAVRL